MATDYKPEIADRIGHDYEAMDERQKPFVPHWKNKAQLVQPSREFVEQIERQDDERGEQLSLNVYSSVPIEANETWANGYQGYMTSKHFPWFRLILEDEDLMETVPGARAWLQKVERVLYHELGRSNFYPQIHALYQDAGWCGTSTLSTEWDMNGEQLVFHAWHPIQILIEQDEHMRVNRLIRRFMESAINLVERLFPDEMDRLSDDVIRAYEGDNPYQKFEIWHSIAPREDRMMSSSANENKPWESVYMEAHKEGILRESGFDSNPYHVWRTTVRSQEVYGRAPADTSWPEILKINRLEQDLSTASQKMVDPAMGVPAEWKGKFGTHPGYNLYYSRDPRRRAFPLQENLRYDIGLDQKQYTEERIRKSFNVDVFALLASATVEDLKNVRATAFSELRNERAILLGPIVGNLEDELLDPTITRVYTVLDQQGKLPPVPETLVRRAGGAPIRVEYMGPLAQMQRAAFEQRAIRDTLRDAAAVIGIDETAKDVFKWQDMMLKIARSHNIDEDLVRSAMELQAVREQRQQQAQQAQAMEVAQGAASAYKDAATPAAPGGEETLASNILGFSSGGAGG